MQFCIKKPNVEYGAKLHNDEPVEVETLEGTVTCHRNDYIMTGVIGEHWVVNEKKFKEKYEKTSWKQDEAGNWRGTVRANPDSSVTEWKKVEANLTSVDLPWGPGGSMKTVAISDADVLILDKEGEYYYPCKKDVFKGTYQTSRSQKELEKWFKQELYKLNQENKSPAKQRTDSIDSGFGSLQEHIKLEKLVSNADDTLIEEEPVIENSFDSLPSSPQEDLSQFQWSME